MQIRVAHSGATDSDQDLPRARGRLLDLLDLRRATDTNKSDGLHDLLLALV
jgi:hypothetical protein